MRKYVILMLCKDDEIYYTDCVNALFSNKEKAIEEMYKCATNELNELKDLGKDFKIVNFDKCVAIYDENNEIITKYEVVEIEREV